MAFRISLCVVSTIMYPSSRKFRSLNSDESYEEVISYNELLDKASILARAEGLTAHAISVEKRKKD